MFYYGETDTGMKRLVNQDSFFCAEIEGMVIAAVCDGMGGANGGSTASALAGNVYLANIRESLTPSFIKKIMSAEQKRDSRVINVMTDAVERANGEVYARAQRDASLSGMGTTLVSVLVSEEWGYAVNVGDSRLYMLKNNTIEQISHDHSYVQELVDMGRITTDEAAINPHKNIITKAVGIGEKVAPDAFSFEMDRTGDTYLLLCSDGLTNFLSEAEICRTVFGDNDIGDGLSSLKMKTDSLICAANANGGGDNITAVLIYLPAEEKE